MVSQTSDPLCDSLKAALRDWCRANCSFTDNLSLTGSIHLSCDGQAVLNCLLQEHINPKAPVKPKRLRRKSFTSSATSLVEKCLQPPADEKEQKGMKQSTSGSSIQAKLKALYPKKNKVSKEQKIDTSNVDACTQTPSRKTQTVVERLFDKSSTIASPPVELPSDILNVSKKSTKSNRQRSYSFTESKRSKRQKYDDTLLSLTDGEDDEPLDVKDLSKSTAEIGCTLCNRNFSSTSCLKEHVIKVHMQIKMHSCDMCDRDFYSKGALKMHKMRQHDPVENQIRCTVCEKSFILAYELREHLVVDHGDSSVVEENGSPNKTKAIETAV